ncbi:hypothetical protein [Dankookia sp. GCM10030260]|uniref:hypothetical protein n=1 Tax=Dankookia sp. GCM10030260 TaxID=3273390 RepID=UPI0036D28B80
MPKILPQRLAHRREPGGAAPPMTYPVTPDGRYFVVRGRLWRCSNPSLSDERRAELVTALMAARRAKQQAMRAGDNAAREAARLQVEAAKVALGERGPVWWDDGTPDFNRHLARTTPYAEWFAKISGGP